MFAKYVDNFLINHIFDWYKGLQGVLLIFRRGKINYSLTR
jgi:hypothetical protein